MTGFEKHPLDPGQGNKTFIAAGPLKYASQLAQFYSISDPEAAPAITAGSAISVKWGGNKAINGGEDFVYDPTSKTAGNCIGLPGDGIESLEEYREPVSVLREIGLRVIFSISNLPKETPIEVLPELAKRVIDVVNPTALEVNLSCPNGLLPDGSLHPPVSSNSEASGELIEAIRNEVGYEVCLGIKDSPHVASLESEMRIDEIRRLAEATSPFIDFVTGINTIGGQDFPELTAGNGKGGMSGPVVADIAKLWLEQWSYFAPNHVAILSCGGVDSQNIVTELPERLGRGAMLVGGAQEFYRTSKPVDLAARWAIASA